jgi:hypothetical protein
MRIMPALTAVAQNGKSLPEACQAIAVAPDS